MTGLRHPVSQALYELQPDGLVRVTDGELSGLFDREGRWVSGDLEEADLHMIIVAARPQLRLSRT